MSKSAMDLVQEAKQQVENLTVDQVAAEVERGDAVLVDIRESEERATTGVIPGAIHAPRGRLEFFADPSAAAHKDELQPDRRVILHCASGGRSALAAKTLQEMGYTNVAHLDGGIQAWREAGKPVDSA